MIKKIIILGRVISKKNSRRNFGHISLPSKAYMVFEEDALWQLKKVKERFKGKVRIDYVFNMKGKLDSDCDNLQCGLNDVLQKAGIIEDDKYIVEGSFRKVAGCIGFWTEIEIEEKE